MRAGDRMTNDREPTSRPIVSATENLRTPVVGREAPVPFAKVTRPKYVVPEPARRDRTTLTILRGVDAGRTFSVGAAITIGRDAACDLCLEDDAVSRVHARVTRLVDDSFVIEDLGSTNGTFVNSEPVRRRVLRSGDRIHVGPHAILRFAMTDGAEEMLQQRLYAASTRDPMTGILNRRAFEERLAAEIAFAQRSRTELWLFLLDLDLFKQINDSFGHAAGDLVLRAVADQAARTIRAGDVLARWGGDELVVLSRATSRAEASALAERLRRAVDRVAVAFEGGVLSATASVGAASLSECADAAPAQLFALADKRLYAAKASGRNVVRFDA